MNEILKDYQPITLEEMKDVRLMNRTDTKFVTTVAKLRQLLQMASKDYRVQEIKGERIAPYYTVYFDTPDFDMFNVHQCGHCNRQKLRIRSYVDSHLNFLEIKTKNSHGRTRKSRVSMKTFDPTNPDHDILFEAQNEEFKVYNEFLNEHLAYAPESLHEQLENNFNRITLVNNNKTERLTIDMNLCFHNLGTSRSVNLDNLAIIELKRDGLEPSPVLEMLRKLRIHPLGFSKYCLGTAFTNDHIRANRFKPRLRTIEKMMQQ
jgi:hypothetical protein